MGSPLLVGCKHGFSSTNKTVLNTADGIAREIVLITTYSSYRSDLEVKRTRGLDRLSETFSIPERESQDIRKHGVGLAYAPGIR